jgi:hypothetical protein
MVVETMKETYYENNNKGWFFRSQMHEEARTDRRHAFVLNYYVKPLTPMWKNPCDIKATTNIEHIPSVRMNITTTTRVPGLCLAATCEPANWVATGRLQ